MKMIPIVLLLVVVTSTTVYAEKKFVVTSEPAGCRVSFNGREFGVTPLETKMKDFLFNGPKYLWSEFLNEPIQMSVSKEGYVTKTMVITNGPYRWVNLNYTAEKIYFVIAQTSWHVKLEKIGEFMGNNPFAQNQPDSKLESMKSNLANGTRPKLTTEQVVQMALPAVVTVQAGTASGSGFFITESGIVVTNRHVVEGSQTASITTSKGETFPSESIFIHPTNDLALIKMKPGKYPYLKIAEPTTLNVGADVFAIGSPGVGQTLLVNTVTKGIASAFRKVEGYGVLVQTDVAINHGNSGGPLLNSSAEVVGVNTLAYRGDGATGLNFAIYSSEMLQMLKEHFNYIPDYNTANPSAVNESRESKKTSDEKVSVEVTSEPTGAEIKVDGNYVSSTPSKLLLTIGEHTIKVTRPGFKNWERKILVEAGSAKTVNAILEKVVQPDEPQKP